MRDNMIIRLATSFLVIFILIVTSSHPTHAWVIERVSLGNSGQETAKYDGSGDIGITSLSYDGRFVCFPSEGTALVDGDTNDKRDIFVRDRTRGTTVRVNVSTEGDQILDYSSYDAVISGDGRFVVFDSQTSNLVTGTTPKKMNIYRHEMATGETVLLTKGHDGSAADDSSAWNSYMDASYDGRFVVFPSFATNLVVGDTNAKTDIFVHDCQTGTTSMVSRSARRRTARQQQQRSRHLRRWPLCGLLLHGDKPGGRPFDQQRTSVPLRQRSGHDSSRFRSIRRNRCD